MHAWDIRICCLVLLFFFFNRRITYRSLSSWIRFFPTQLCCWNVPRFFSTTVASTFIVTVLYSSYRTCDNGAVPLAAAVHLYITRISLALYRQAGEGVMTVGTEADVIKRWEAAAWGLLMRGYPVSLTLKKYISSLEGVACKACGGNERRNRSQRPSAGSGLQERASVSRLAPPVPRAARSFWLRIFESERLSSLILGPVRVLMRPRPVGGS